MLVSMKIHAIGVVAVLSGLSIVSGGEKKLEKKDLPPAVRSAIEAETKGATIKGYAKEVEKGKTFYEVEMVVDGRTRDVTFSESGQVASIEQEVALDSLPAAAREALQKAAGDGKIALVEMVTAGGKTTYEAHIQQGKKSKEIKIDDAGKTLQ